MDLPSRRYAMRLSCVVGAIGPARYGDIEAACGKVSSSTLSTRLDDLVEAGILAHERYAEILHGLITNSREELREHLDPLLSWAEEIDEKTIS